MKKLMIAAAIVCAAAFANAASVGWGVDSVWEMGKGGENYANGYYAYFFDADTYSTASAIAALSDGNVGTVTAAALGAAVEVSDGMASQAGLGSYESGSTVNGYLVIFNDAAEDATYAFVSSIGTTTIPTSGAAGNIAFGDLTGTQTSSNWTKIGGEEPIPEPTSGLLMLLGMGALALRRRRA